MTISRCGVSLWDLQTISNGSPPSLSWSVQTGEIEWIFDSFHADKYQIVLVAIHGKKVIMFVNVCCLQQFLIEILTQFLIIASCLISLLRVVL